MGKRSRSRKLREPLPHTTPGPQQPTDRRQTLIVCAALLVVIGVIYAQVRNHQFTNLDDPNYIVDNRNVQSGLTAASLRWALTSMDFNWHPMTWLTHLIDIEFFGLDPAGHHVTSVLFHAINTLLFFFVFLRATKELGRSAVVAAIFAVHPLHVESVAWIAERKDVLSGFFFVLTLWFYVGYVETHSRVRYLLCAIALLLGLAAKQMLVTVPLVLLLIDYWPLRRFDLKDGKRIRELVIEKLPLFAIVIPAMAVTVIAQRAVKAVISVEVLPLKVRVANAIVSYVRYLEKTFWPAGLAIPYPYELSIPAWKVIAAIVLLLTITAVVWRFRERRYLFTGWFWFVGMLVPVIGIVQVGVQSMADRYTYLPMIGLSAAVVWLIADFVPAVRLQFAIAAVALVVLTAAARMQASYWHDSETLFRHSLAVNERNALAHGNLGSVLLLQSDYAEAAFHFERAIAISPRYVEPRVGLGTAKLRLGDRAEAERLFKEALKLDPRNAVAYQMLGEMAFHAGNTTEAAAMLEKADSIKPGGEAGATLALARGNLDDAIARYENAMRADSRSAEIRNSLAAALARKGRDAEALAQYEEALRLAPHHYDARMNLGALLSRLGRTDDAIAQFVAAAESRPGATEPRVYLALVCAQNRRVDEAIDQITKAIAADHDGANAQLTSALRIPPKPTNIDEYLAYLQTNSAARP